MITATAFAYLVTTPLAFTFMFFALTAFFGNALQRLAWVTLLLHCSMVDATPNVTFIPTEKDDSVTNDSNIEFTESEVSYMKSVANRPRRARFEIHGTFDTARSSGLWGVNDSVATPYVTARRGCFIVVNADVDAVSTYPESNEPSPDKSIWLPPVIVERGNIATYYAPMPTVEIFGP